MSDISHPSDDWNPMKEDYFDHRVNSYDTGAGANLPKHLQPSFIRKDENYTVKLYVSPLNSRFDKNSLKNLFSEYGEVIDVHIDPKGHWGFVYLKSQSAANKAISVMNDNPNFKFKVSYAKEKDKSQDSKTQEPRRHTEPPKSSTSNSENYDEPKTNVKKMGYSSETQKNMESDSEPSTQTESPDDRGAYYVRPVTNGIELPSRPSLQFRIIPNCYHCKHATLTVCLNCETPFCSMKCALIGFKGHTGACIRVAPIGHSRLDENNTVENRRESNIMAAPQKIGMNVIQSNVTNTVSPNPYVGQEGRFSELNDPDTSKMFKNFNDTTIDYRNNYQRPVISTSRISSSYDVEISDHNSENSSSSRTTETQVGLDREHKNGGCRLNVMDGNHDKPQNSGDNDINDSRSVLQSDCRRSEDGIHLRRRNSNRASNRTDGKEGGYRKSDEHKKPDRVSGKSEGRYGKSESGFRDGSSGQRRPQKNEPPKTIEDETDNKENFIGFGSNNNNRKLGCRGDRPPKSNFRKDGSATCDLNRSMENHSSRSSESKHLLNGTKSISGDKLQSRSFERFQKEPVCNDDLAASTVNSRSQSSFTTSNELPSFNSGRVFLEKDVKIEVQLNESPPMTTITIPKEKKLFTELMECIKKEPSLQPVPELYEKLRCLANRKEVWYRSMIMTVNPLTVRFIDMGARSYTVAETDIKQLPEQYANVPSFCYPVKFRNATDDELNEIKTNKIPIEIIPVEKKPGSAWLVDLVKKKPFEKQLEEARQIRDSKKPTCDHTKPEPDLTISLKPNVPYNMFVTLIKDNESFFVSDWSKLELLTKMINEEDIDLVPALKDPVDGSTCLAPYGNEWYRAKVVSLDPFKVHYIDFGNADYCDQKQLKILPDKYFKYKELAIPVKLEKGTVEENNIEQDGEVTIIPVERDLKVKMWIVRTIAKSNDQQTENVIEKVIMLYSVSSLEYFVTETQNKEILDKLGNIDEKLFFNNKVKRPELGLLCLVEFEGCWSRAKIIKTSPLTVIFIDFGNEKEVVLEEMHLIPEEWQNIPPLAFKITLKAEPPVEIQVFDKLSITKRSDNLWELLAINEREIKANVTRIKNRETEVVAASVERIPACLSTPTNVPVITTESGNAVTNISSNEKRNIEENEIIEIFVMAKLEDGEYGAIRSEKMQIYRYLMQELENSSSILEKLVRPQVDDLCVVNARDSLYRAKIIEINPVTVFLLDLGIEDIVGENDLRSMPKHLKEIEELSFRITFDDDTLVFEEYDQMFIEIVSEIYENFFLVRKHNNEIPSSIACIEQHGTESINNCIIKSSSVTSNSRESQLNIGNSVRISDELTSVADARSKPVQVENTQDFQTFNNDFISSYPQMPAIKNIINEFYNNLVGVFQVQKQYSKNLFSGLTLLKHSEINNMLKELNQLKHDNNFRPVTGELIATVPKNNQCWTRGFVLSEPTNLNPDYKVVLIDNGYVCFVNSIAPLPTRFKQIPSLALTCEIMSFPRNKSALKMKGYNYQISSVSILKNTAKGVLWKKSADLSFQIQFTTWKPSIDEIGMQSVVFKTNDRVKITSYNTSKKCYIISADDDNNDKRMEILDSTMKFCINAPPLNRKPRFDEIVGVFHEETFWRGQVLHEEDESYLVLIIDNGNEVEVLPDKMKALPERLKMPYCTAVPVILANLPITEINQKAGNYMKNIITEGKEFKLVIEDSCEVLLQFVSDQDYKENSGRTSLNEYLNFLLTPEWKLPRVDHLQFEETKFTGEYLKYDHYDVGTKLTLYLLETDPELKTLIMINRNGKSWKRMNQVNLEHQLQEYGEAVNEAYTPVIDELCLVKSENMWYRGLCLEREPGKRIKVYLIDCGQIKSVWHTDIRRMISEFLNYNAVALLCYIKDPSIDSKKHDVKLLENREISGCTIVECLEPPEYRIVIKNLYKYFKQTL